MSEKALETLIRLRRDALDRRRQILASLEDRRATIDQRQAALEAHILDEQDVAGADATVLFAYQGFARRSIAERETLTRAAVDLDGEIDAASDDLRLAFSELKKFEIARDERERREMDMLDRREQQTADELALSRFRHTHRAAATD